MKKMTVLVKQVLMSTLTAGMFAIAFTACSDDIDMEKEMKAPETPSSLTRSLQADEYNINNDTAKYYKPMAGKYVMQEPFTAENWWKSQGIFLYDKNYNDDITDKFDHKLTGFRFVNLPWSNAASDNRVPEQIWKEVAFEGTPWQLVMNHCGSMATNRGNYFAVYNPYTGIMRYFVYIPENIGGNYNNHMWLVGMNPQLASHSVYGYGVPMDNSNFQPQNVGAVDENGNAAIATTPWVGKSNIGTDGLAPEIGWWSFDVDLSLYRDNADWKAAVDNNSYIMTPSLRVNEKMNVDLQSAMKGALDGDMKLETQTATTTGGVFGFIDEAVDKVSTITDLVGDIKSGDPLKAIKAGVSLAKEACNMAGIDYGAETVGFNGYKGTVNMQLNAEITTKGEINASKNVQNFGSPTLKLGNFDLTAAPTFGEGVWNIKNTPVVYYTNVRVGWKREFQDSENDYKGYEWWCKWGNSKTKSPFDGLKTWHQKYYGSSYKYNTTDTDSDKPFHGCITFFDPSNIEVCLNPNVFPADKIEYMKVQSVCGVRKNMNFGGTDKYREAMGLKNSNIHIDNVTNFYNRPLTDAPFSACETAKDDNMNDGATFSAMKYQDRQRGIVGHGNADYIIDPMALSGGKQTNDYSLPAYEVNVTVIVKMKDMNQPIILNRVYLPEYKSMDAKEVINYGGKAATAPAHYDKDLYKTQHQHIAKIADWLLHTLQPLNGPGMHYWNTQIGGQVFDSVNDSYCNLFDGDPKTRWCTDEKMKNGRHGNFTIWATEFQSNCPISPKSFTITTGTDVVRFPSTNPEHIFIYAKKSPNDNWQEVAHYTLLSLPGKINFEKTFDLNNCNNAKNTKYFRLEVLNAQKFDKRMQFSEFRFND